MQPIVLLTQSQLAAFVAANLKYLVVVNDMVMMACVSQEAATRNAVYMNDHLTVGYAQCRHAEYVSAGME